ncbi:MULTISPECIES: glucose 1-dehydrogenase [unclassified Lysobacter]|uniref:SDR family NAD(P)-dependent oxidoreductase n=1 Tax=unclassified Lysobacter TaxID=2635362 RepID=UPI0006F5FF92|nr:MULTISPECIES: glucose 1-dehydrogenase [unclassified Lysobacter]KQZ57452.1 oxidoreductase [Lysobacter sp. Root559]KRC34604.1 oxidoreductase [Lysobacter sp. Root76]KRD65910.1 oxidoreductase [Lysobacter sp. Root96]
MQASTPGFGLRDKVVLVTGASSGIGAATARAFAREGAIVLAAARRAAEGEAVAESIRAEGGRARFLQADVTREDDIRRLVETAVADYGRLDVAFNNAGTDGRFAPFVEQDDANYEYVMNTNVRSVFWSMKHQIAAMLRSGGGAIVNNASMGALIGFQNAAVYIASKHAVMGLTKTAALEYFPRGIRVNAVLPGIIDTPFQDRVWGDEAAKQAFANATVAGRSGTAEEVAGAALFLASGQASFFSGQGLVMDGGYVTQ